MFSKKTILVFVLAIAIALSATAMAEVVDASNVMEKIVQANTAEALLKNHESVYVQIYAIESYVMDTLMFVEKYVDDELVYYNNMVDMPEILLTDGTSYIEYFGLFGKPVGIGGVHQSPSIEPLILASSSTNETVLNIKTVNGALIINTELSGDQLRKLDPLVDPDVTRAVFVYCADAESFELYRTEEVYFYDDGSVRCGVTTVTYDAGRPEPAQQMYEHSQLTDTRTVTIIMDPGTDEEQTITMQVAKGDYIITQFFDSYTTLYDDAECTIRHTASDNTADMTLYTKKEK